MHRPCPKAFVPTSPPDQLKSFWDTEGYLRVDKLLTAAEVASLRTVYNDMLSGKIAGTDKHRYDLGAGAGSRKMPHVENITQIMWPSDLHAPLRDAPFRQRALDLARVLLDDPTVDFDFDMLCVAAAAALAALAAACGRPEAPCARPAILFSLAPPGTHPLPPAAASTRRRTPRRPRPSTRTRPTGRSWRTRTR